MGGVKSLGLFRELAAKGGELVQLHLMEAPVLNQAIASYPGKAEPGTRRSLARGRVHISKDDTKSGKRGFLKTTPSTPPPWPAWWATTSCSCAGREADLFESTAAENIGAMILGVAVFVATGNEDWILFPLVVRAFGLIACIEGILFVWPKENEDPMPVLNRGYYVVALHSACFLALVTYVMLDSWWFFASGLVGIAVSIAFAHIT